MISTVSLTPPEGVCTTALELMQGQLVQEAAARLTSVLQQH
jgi:hypothetical protein